MLVNLLPVAWRPFAKAILAALLPVLSVIVVGLLSPPVSAAALVGATVGAIGAIGAIVTAAVPTLKTLVGALVILAGLVVTGLVTGAWDAHALSGAIVAVLGALLVHEVPNAPKPRAKRQRPPAD